MTTNDLPMIAGSTSTVIFVTSYLPMLLKAVRTKDLSSYSPTQLVLTNFGNVLYSAYVFSLPVGPIWALHSFYLVATALMLAWYVRYTRGARPPVLVGRRPRPPSLTDRVRGLKRRAAMDRTPSLG